MNIKITNQAQLDALPESFKQYTVIEIDGGTPYAPIIVSKARGSSHVVAWGSSHVEAWESSHVEAWGSSHVEARGSSHVEARESSHVVAWGSSHVVAWESVSVHIKSEFSEIVLFEFAVAIAISKKCKIKRKSKTCTVVHPVLKKGTGAWLEREGITASKSTVTLFKRVSSDLKTQESTKNETQWGVGSTLEHTKWTPDKSECGEGKFHACSRPYFCDEFRSTIDDRYIAIAIAVKDLHAWNGGQYPHKIAFRRGVVLYECDRYGAKIDAKGDK